MFINKGLKKILLTTCFCFLGSSAFANDICPEFSLYFSGDSGSYHFNREIESNEKNYIHGIGCTFKKGDKLGGFEFDKETDVFAMGVINSEGYYSRGIGFNRKEFCFEKNSAKGCLGWSGGIIDGYPQNDFKPTPVLLPIPLLSGEYKNAGIDMYFGFPVTIIWAYKIKF